jgi:hypothetical protein
MHPGILTALALLSLLVVPTASAQPAPTQAPQPMDRMPMADGASKTLPSPVATASVNVGGKELTIRYNAPSMRGRKIMGGLVPFGQVWRTGANPATTFITAAHLKIGTLDVPAGTYTLYTLPAADSWMLIINKQTGQSGLTYDQLRISAAPP